MLTSDLFFFLLPLESCGASHAGSAKTLPSVLAPHDRRGPDREKEARRPAIREHSAPASSLQLENGKQVESVATAHRSGFISDAGKCFTDQISAVLQVICYYMFYVISLNACSLTWRNKLSACTRLGLRGRSSRLCWITLFTRDWRCGIKSIRLTSTAPGQQTNHEKIPVFFVRFTS